MKIKISFNIEQVKNHKEKNHSAKTLSQEQDNSEEEELERKLKSKNL